MRLEWASPKQRFESEADKRFLKEETNRTVLNHESFGETKGHKRLKGQRGSLMSVRPQMHTTKDKSVSKG
jgi:hypothetical protein